MIPLYQARLGSAVWVLTCCGAHAAQSAVSQPPVSPLSLGGLLQVLFGLALVLAAIAGTAWVMRRLAPGQTSAGGALKLIGGIAVGPKERVVLVEIGDTWLVLGIAPGRVTALHTLDKPETARIPSEASGKRSFATWLAQFKSRHSK
ncbi:MAG: flagellar biosynthetic protein FliO [Burkholderiales bacterium]